MQFNGFSLLLATLPFLSGLVEAGCTHVRGGVGGNPLKCTSYDAPRNVGSSVNGPLNSLTISRVEDDTNHPDWRFYTFKNNMNYDINFAVQFWNPNTQQNNWQTYTLSPDEKCDVHFLSTLQNFKLTC
ncbi:EC60 protein [Colletotrichum asianum]|uniref:AA1-like domain-containing protein n=1 Tax=Colletotrichum asianum TaxID=702518 RepID=A0A8H3ZLF0_9PEZI|nr:hypothetical protein GQ607_009079 [Colletotrichum asianum]